LKHATRIRESNGRILGVLDDYWLNSEEDENWQDHKCIDVRFPEHNQKLSGKCITYHISELNKN
jgi:hypothetical protein